MIFKEDFKRVIPECKTCKCQSRRIYLLYIVSATVIAFASIIALICTVCCYNVLAEMKRLQQSSCTKYAVTMATDCLTQEPGLPERAAKNILRSETDVLSDKEKQEYFLNDFDREANGIYDRKADDKYKDGRRDGHEADLGRYVGYSSEGDAEMFGSDGKKQIRKRRSTTDDIKKCRRKCKGPEKKKCRKKCGSKNKRHIAASIMHLPKVNLPAAHFEANMYDKATQILVDNIYNKPKQAGEGPLMIFKQAQWVDSFSPANLDRESVARIKSGGIFIVYAQVYIGGNEPEKIIKIVQKRKGRSINTLSCDNGVNSSSSSSSQTQTCSVFGLMKLEQGDTVEIQRSLVTIGIVLDDEKTFFGMIQLTGVPVTPGA